MNTLKFLSFILLPFSYLSCKCYGADCNGGVAERITVYLVNKSTEKPLNAASINLSLEGFNFASPSKGTEKDSARISFGTGLVFVKQGTYNGVLKVDGAIVGKFALKLVAGECCDDYPESGTSEVIEGNLTIRNNSGNSKLYQSSPATFILKL
jgi:hypothetical protein